MRTEGKDVGLGLEEPWVEGDESTGRGLGGAMRREGGGRADSPSPALLTGGPGRAVLVLGAVAGRAW